MEVTPLFLSHHTVLEYVVPRESPPGSGLRGGAGVRRWRQRLGAVLIVVVIISRTSSFGSGASSV